MSASVSTVFFDVGETLLHTSAPLHALYARVINEKQGTRFGEEKLQSVIQELLERMPMRAGEHFRYGDGWFDIFIRSLLENLDCPKPWNGIRDGLFRLFDDTSTFIPYPDARPCTEEILALGLKTAVVSNWGYRLSGLLEKLSLNHGFETIIASADVEKEKPDPEIFEIALAKTASKPEQTIHIGDSLDQDVVGARAAGLHAVLLDRKRQHPDREDRICSLSDLVPYLKGKGLIA